MSLISRLHSLSYDSRSELRTLFFDVRIQASLALYLLDAVLQIMLFEITLAHGGHEERRICEEVVHLLKRSLRSLWLDGP